MKTEREYIEEELKAEHDEEERKIAERYPAELVDIQHQLLREAEQETAKAVDYWKTHRNCGVCRDYKTKRCDRFDCMTIFIEEYRRRERGAGE